MPSLLLDLELTIVAVNPAYRAATLNREDLDGAYIFEAFPDNAEDPEADGVARLSASFERVRQTRRRHNMVIQRYDIPTADKLGWVHKVWSPVNSPVRTDGELVGLLHQVQDVTDAADGAKRAMQQARAFLEGLPDPDDPRAMDFAREVEQFTTAVAQHAEALDEVTSLRRALTSRATIDMAKGIVMAERRCSPDEAFETLVSVSSRANVKVADVAAALVYQAQGSGNGKILPPRSGSD